MDYVEEPTYRGLIEEIVACPQNREPRWILADWLDDRCEAAARAWGAWLRNSLTKGYPIHLEPAQSSMEPFSAMGLPLWRGSEIGKPGRVWHRATRFVILGGFVEEVRCGLRDWVQWGPAIAAVHPLLHVRLLDRPPLSEHRGKRCSYASWRDGYTDRLGRQRDLSDLPHVFREYTAGDSLIVYDEIDPDNKDWILDFGSEEEARAWVSGVALAWAKDPHRPVIDPNELRQGPFPSDPEYPEEE